MSTPVVRALNVHKSYDHLHVLKGVDLEVVPSEIVAIVGKSGAGKSTLLHILGTIDSPDSGDVFIQGRNIGQLKQRPLAELRNKEVGFIFQFHHLLNEFTALENVGIPGYIRGLPKHEVDKQAEELLTYLGLKDRMSHKPGEMSGGEQQRVAVARALINSPSIVLADEPTGNLDSETSAEMHRLFLNLRKDFGQSFIIVTHNKELAGMCDRTLEMLDGQFISDSIEA
jgi:lipoprotein-releasing system ATP-binding protein